jgi:hypothetical protein
VWGNDGTGRFTLHGEYRMGPTPEIGYSISMAVALADLDGDGDLDAYVANCCRNQWSMSGANQIRAQGFADAHNHVWWNDGDGRFADSGQRLGNWATGALALGDLDGDGDLDAFEVNRATQAEANVGDPRDMVWLNDGSGQFADTGQRLDEADGYAVALGDLDGDGDLDAWVGNAYHGPANSVWLNDGRGQFADSGQRLGEGNTRRVLLDDVDGDGDLDALADNRDFGQLWTNDGAGRFIPVDRRFNWDPPYAVDLGDVDGDGDVDVFAIRFSGKVLIWRNDGTGRFRRP